jgi:hypothetical protein
VDPSDREQMESQTARRRNCGEMQSLVKMEPISLATSHVISDCRRAEPDWTPDLQRFNAPSTSPADQNQLQGSQPRLPLIQLRDWDPDLPYDEFPPTCIHYSIEWKLLLAKGRLAKLTGDTEQNLVLVPGAFWNLSL